MDIDTNNSDINQEKQNSGQESVPPPAQNENSPGNKEPNLQQTGANPQQSGNRPANPNYQKPQYDQNKQHYDKNRNKPNNPNAQYPNNKNYYNKDRQDNSAYNKYNKQDENAGHTCPHDGDTRPGSSYQQQNSSCNMRDYCVSKAKYGLNSEPEVSPVAEVQFKCKRKRLYRNDPGILLREGDKVLVEIESGVDMGTVISCGSIAVDKQRTIYKTEKPEFSLIRKANPDDLEKARRNYEEEARAVEKTREFVHNFKLDMKVTEAEWQYDHQRLTIYFTAPQRIDFRELVKELARTFKTRIELRQISTREEAKRIGGMGPCGRHLCCSSFINEFSHVTLDHARTQQLSNNVAKLSGYCGRLKCCLLYEYDNYVEVFKKYPPLNSVIELPEGNARILKVDIFKDNLCLVLEGVGAYKNITFEDLVKLDREGKVIPPPRDDSGFARQDIYYEDPVDLQLLQEEDVF